MKDALLDSSIIEVDEKSILKILQCDYDLSSFVINTGADGNIKSKTIDLGESDLILLGIFNTSEKIIFLLLLIATKIAHNNEEKVVIGLKTGYENEFNRYVLKLGDRDHDHSHSYLLRPEVLKFLLAFFSRKKFKIFDLLEVKNVITRVLQYFDEHISYELDNNKAKLLFDYLTHNNSSNTISFRSFSDYLRGTSDINPEISNLDNFILKNRPDVVIHCSQPLFEFKIYQKWLVNHGLNEYGLHFFLNEKMILNDMISRSESKLLINCRDFRYNGLGKLKLSLIEAMKEFVSEISDLGLIFSIGGALEFSDIYPLNIFADNKKLKVAIWVWELNTISADSVRYLHNFDEIWTLSADSQIALRMHGLPSRIVRFPLGVKNYLLPVNNKHGKYFLTFVDFDSGFNRKNPLSTILAFQQAFESQPDVNLVLKVSKGANDLKNYSLIQDICRLDNRIKLINKILSDEEILNLFHNCLAFISAHRAEGLGLNIVEAVRDLKPAIISKFSAPMEYLPDSYHYFVSGTLKPIESDSKPYNLPNAEWFEPEINEIAKFLNEIYLGEVFYRSLEDAKEYLEEYFDEQNDNSLRSNLLRIISKTHSH